MSLKKASVDNKGDSRHVSVVVQGKQETPAPRHLLLVTPASNKNLPVGSGTLQLPKSEESDVWESTAPIGLLTSESPDSVAAWRGYQRSSLYGKPFLACDTASRVLVLPEPIYMMWPKWMDMGSAAAQQVSNTNIQQGEKSIHLSVSGSFPSKGGNVKKQSTGESPTNKTTTRVARSSFIPTKYDQTSSRESISRQPPSSEGMGETEQ